MLELGSYSKKLHESIAPLINQTKIDKVFVKGKMASLIYKKISNFKKGRILSNKSQIDDLIKNDIKNNDYLLLHGQNDTIVPIAKMHNAVEQLEHVAKTLSKKIYNDLEHSINEEGIIEGLNFIKGRMPT